jgi:hypothetical protein
MDTTAREHVIIWLLYTEMAISDSKGAQANMIRGVK